MFSRIVDQYQGSIAVIIGAGGIGGEIVRLLVPCVKHIVVADHSEAALAALTRECGSEKLLTKKLDVRDSVAVDEFARFVSTNAGTPQFLFYTAGILTIEPFVETTPQNWERAVAVNLSGAFYCTKAIADLMIPQNWREFSFRMLRESRNDRARNRKNGSLRDKN